MTRPYIESETNPEYDRHAGEAVEDPFCLSESTMKYPDGWKSLKPHIRIVPQPK